jgi:hypothetical protein
MKIMSPHKQTYFRFYNLEEGDHIACGVCRQPAVDIHAIHREGMGGDDKMARPENLVALCRQHHNQLGERKQYKSMLYKIVFYDLMRKDLDFDFEWIVNQIKRYE